MGMRRLALILLALALLAQAALAVALDPSLQEGKGLLLGFEGNSARLKLEGEELVLPMEETMMLDRQGRDVERGYFESLLRRGPVPVGFLWRREGKRALLSLWELP